MKKILSLLLCAALLLTLTACGGSSKTEAMYSAGAMVEEAAPMEAPMAADNTASLKGSQSGSTALPEGRKWIITIDMNVETDNLEVLMADLDEKINALGGYVEDQNIHNGSNFSSRRYRNANLTIRIPDEKVDQFTSEVTGMANVVSQNLRREDITLKYVATSSRVTALETEEARLLELLSKAETMEDLLTIEARLTDVRYELESVTSQLRVYDNLVDYATINLNIEEVQEYTPVAEETLWQRISGGFMDSLEGVGNFFVELFAFLIISLPYLALIAAVIALIVFLCKRSAKKRRAKRAACPPPVYPPYPPQNMPPAQGDNQQ